MDDLVDEVFDPNALFLDELERRAELERAGYEAAEIAFAIERAGPLVAYAKERRADAVAALKWLSSFDPCKATPAEVVAQQMKIHEWLRLCAFVEGRMMAAREAEAQIKEEFPDAEGQEDQD